MEQEAIQKLELQRLLVRLKPFWLQCNTVELQKVHFGGDGIQLIKNGGLTAASALSILEQRVQGP